MNPKHGRLEDHDGKLVERNQRTKNLWSAFPDYSFNVLKR